jgi:hypothetical protein
MNVENKKLLSTIRASLLGLTLAFVVSGFFATAIVLSPQGRALASTQVACMPPSGNPGLSLPKSCETYDCTGLSQRDCLKNNPITQWVVFGINLLGALIVIGASAMIVFAGIEYIAAADNPERVKKAKQKITNVIIGIVAFFFLYAFLQWLIPGGAF